MPPLYDPKDLTQWMELDYFRQRPPLYRRLRTWSWCALGVSVVFVLSSLLPANQRVYQAGPVSTAHAMFGNNCSVCHTQHFQTIGRLVHGDKGIHSVPDEACIQCHPGPDHHVDLERGIHVTSKNCASCHKEHHGQNPLALVPSGFCTECHATLESDHAGKTTFRNVNSFAAHPEFALWDHPRDTGTVQFSH